MRCASLDEMYPHQKKTDVAAATANTNGDQKFFKCRQPRHVKKDCLKKGKGGHTNRNSSGGSNNANNEECPLCGQKGHKIATCWEKSENASKQPDGYKPKLSLDKVKKQIAKASTGNTEVQAARVDVDDVKIEDSEFTCTTISLPETAFASISLNSGSQKLLKCSDTWIRYTGATQHSTFGAVGGTNKHKCNIQTKDHMGNATSTLVLIDFKVKLCDIHGKCYRKAVLQDLQVNICFNYNLFSIN